jgi:hypothetical protein
MNKDNHRLNDSECCIKVPITIPDGIVHNTGNKTIYEMGEAPT